MSKVDRPNIRIPMISDGILKPNGQIYKGDEGDLYILPEDLAIKQQFSYGIEGADAGYCTLIIYVPDKYLENNYDQN